MPRPRHLRGTWVHRTVGDGLFSPDLWRLSRGKFAGGFAVGAFFALIPAPFQMLGAAIIAYVTRVNIPAAVAATWLSNPFTFPICIYAQYWLGCLILRKNPMEIPSHDLVSVLKQVPVPYLVGTLPAAALLAAISYPLCLIVWDALSTIASRKQREKP